MGALKEICSQIADLPPIELVVSNVGASIENAIRLDAGDLDIKGMPLVQVGGLRLAPQCLGDLFTRTGKLPLRRGPRLLGQFVRVDLVHNHAGSAARRRSRSAAMAKQARMPLADGKILRHPRKVIFNN